MFTLNDDLSIYATRGDIVFFSVSAEDEGYPYKFKAGDVVRFKVYEKKNAENVVLQKDFPVVMLETPDVGIYLTAEDTKIGDVISKHKDYWYEVELNPDSAPQTIIGYDEDGAKLFRLFPEGADIPPYEPIKPEDIPIVDDELDLTSHRPIGNQAVARAIVALEEDYKETKETVITKTNDTAEALAVERSRIDNLIAHEDVIVNQALEYSAGASDKYDATITSDGVRATIKVNLREANLFIAGGTHNVFFIPDECRPIDVGRLHTEYGMAFDIRYDNDSNRYVLAMGTEVEGDYAPTQACVITMTYALADYELKDIRVGADGVTYPTAGEAVREQIACVASALDVVRPTNYAELTSEDIVMNPNGFEVAANVTTIKVSNLAQPVNGYVVFKLNSLESGKEYILSMVSNGFRNVSIRTDTDAENGAPGNIVVTSGEDENGEWSCGFTAPNKPVTLCFWIRYSNASATATSISLVERGAQTNVFVKPECVRGIGMENLSSELKETLFPDANPCDYTGDDICAFSKGLCIGDSLTQGVFNYYADGTIANYVTDESRAYPAYLQKMTGVQTTNAGEGGYTSVGWYDKYKNTDLSGYDFAIVHLGVNDVYRLGGWTEESEAAFAGIISKLKSDNRNIKVFVSTIVPAKSYTGVAFDSVSEGIRNFVASLADDDVFLLDMAVYGHAADEDAYNCGHLSAYGYWRMAKDFKNYISWCMSNKPAAFAEIQFVGTDYMFSHK